MTIAEPIALVVAPRLEIVQELLRAPGEPCLTVLLPPYRPGGHSKSQAALLKAHLKTAGRELAAHGHSPSRQEELLAPLYRMSSREDLRSGVPWSRVIFRSPARLQQFLHFHLTAEEETLLVVGRHFFIRPILAALHLPLYAYILKLSQKQVELLRLTPFTCEGAPLPKGAPHSLEEFLAFDRPDHNQENRSPVGGASGAARRVRFGTSSYRDSQQAYLSDFFKAVDRGIQPLFGTEDAPLILAGVSEEVALYRNQSSYRNLLGEAITGSTQPFPCCEELLRQAGRILHAEQTRRAAAALAEFCEKLAPTRLLTNLDRILPAAIQGRVHHLYLNEEARRMGYAGRQGKWGQEDLLNLAAVRTLAHGGQAFTLPAERMPERVLAAAVLRY